MAKTITSLLNQSMLDVIIMACGSLEAAGQFCSDNGVAISDVPVVGTVYQVSDAALAAGDSSVLNYLAKNSIIIGTYGSAPVVSILTTEDGTVITDENGNAFEVE